MPEDTRKVWDDLKNGKLYLKASHEPTGDYYWGVGPSGELMHSKNEEIKSEEQAKANFDFLVKVNISPYIDDDIVFSEIEAEDTPFFE